MSTGGTYAFSGTYEWSTSSTSENTGILSTVSDTQDFRTLSKLRFDSQTAGSSEVLGSGNYKYEGTFELLAMEQGFAPADLKNATLTVQAEATGLQRSRRICTDRLRGSRFVEDWHLV